MLTSAGNLMAGHEVDCNLHVSLQVPRIAEAMYRCIQSVYSESCPISTRRLQNLWSVDQPEQGRGARNLPTH